MFKIPEKKIVINSIQFSIDHPVITKAIKTFTISPPASKIFLNWIQTLNRIPRIFSNPLRLLSQPLEKYGVVYVYIRIYPKARQKKKKNGTKKKSASLLVFHPSSSINCVYDILSLYS